MPKTDGIDSILVPYSSLHGFEPSKSYEGDAGWDLYTTERVVVRPHGFAVIPTGIHMALPEGYWAYLTGRSSTFYKKRLFVIPAVIDQGYRGELLINVYNTQDEFVEIEAESRVAQLVPHRIVNVKWKKSNNLGKTQRGIKGFGSSGS